MNDALQTLVAAVVVLACVWRAFRRYAPKTAWRLQAELSFAFERRGRPGWSRRIGKSLRPAVATPGCGSGCSSCSGCALAPALSAPPLRLARRR